jgi:hypothetical protein
METKEALKRAAEAELCKRDIKRHIEGHMTIKMKDGVIRKLQKLTPAQVRLLNLYLWSKAKKLPVRVIILKARKQGLSTVVEAIMFIEALEREIDCIVIAHDKFTAQYIFRMTKLMYDGYDLEKPAFGGDKKKEMDFGDDHHGYLVVETANNVQAGTGITPQFIHGSEISKWAKGSETAISLFQSIGDDAGTTVILESTANGYDSLFKPYWDNAWANCKITWTDELEPIVDIVGKDDWNGYLPLFIPWFEDPRYTRQFDTKVEKEAFILTTYEEWLVETFHVTNEQLLWRRWTINNKCQGNWRDPRTWQVFQQEYPATPREAFISSGRPRFNSYLLDQMRTEPPMYGYLYRKQTWNRNIVFEREESAPLKIFRLPKSGRHYVLGCDTAEGRIPEGSRDSDSSVIQVLDAETGVQQAVFRAQISEDEIVEPLLLLGEWYNWGYINVENNSTGKHTALRLLDEYPKHRLYFTDGRRQTVPGWRTHAGNRNLLISTMDKAISEGTVEILDEDTIDECVSFVYKDNRGRVEAEVGKHDDLVMALGLALVALPKYPWQADRRPMYDMPQSSPRTMNQAGY